MKHAASSRPFFTFLIAFGFLLLLSLPVKADYMDDFLFDHVYYYRTNSDVARVYGSSRSRLWYHFTTWGMREGRRPSLFYDPNYYYNRYPDLRNAFGRNYVLLYRHFKNYGIREGRQASSQFDVNAYKANYSDLRAAYGTASSNNWKYFRHYMLWGANEHRVCDQLLGGTAAPAASPSVPSNYDQLVNAFLNDARWRPGTWYGYNQRPKISGYSSSGCAAYCADFCKYVFGKSSPTRGTAFYHPSQIRSGDIVKVLNTQHWFVVLYRNGQSLTVVEGNWTGGRVVKTDGVYTVNGNTLLRNGSRFRTFSVGYHFQ